MHRGLALIFTLPMLSSGTSPRKPAERFFWRPTVQFNRYGAQLNSQPVAGEDELAADFEHLRDPDSDPDVGSLIQRDSY